MVSRLKFDIGDLIDEQFSQFPTYIWESDNTTFCDLQMGGGQFIQAIGRWLQKYGHSDDNIRKRVFGFSEKPLYLSYIKSNPSLIGTFDVYKENINMKFDVIVGNPPYQVDTGGVRNKIIWNSFVEKSFELCKTDGYVSLLHPPNWRDVGGAFLDIKKLMFSKNIKYINVNDVKQGQNIFKVTTPFDWYIIQNNSNKSLITINDIDGNETTMDIKDLKFIPNGSVDLIKSLIASENQERVEILHSSSYYDNRQKWMSDLKTKSHKLPCVRFVYENGRIDCYFSSENKGHFGIPKVMVGSMASSGEILIDSDGKYGMSPYMFGIVDLPENLPLIKKAIESEKFKKLMDDCRFSRVMFNRRVISLFRKDFWKEFI